MAWDYSVSAIMPVYNGEEFVDSAIQSVLAQTLDSVELVILNDGSTDDSRSVIDQYLPRDRITYVEQANQGVTQTVNRGIRLARGKFLTVHPQDDVSLPQRFEKQVEILEQNPDVGFVYSPAKFVDSDGNELSEWGDWQGEGRISGSALFYKLFIDGMFIASPSVLFRRNHIDDPTHPWGDPDLQIVSDWEHWMAAAQHYDAYELGEPVVEMLRDEDHDNLASRTGQVLQEEKQIIDRVRERYADGTHPVKRRHFFRAMSNYHLRKLRHHLHDERNYTKAARTTLQSLRYNPLNKKLYYEYVKSAYAGITP